MDVENAVCSSWRTVKPLKYITQMLPVNYWISLPADVPITTGDYRKFLIV